jgi:hypothetical protein
MAKTPEQKYEGPLAEPINGLAIYLTTKDAEDADKAFREELAKRQSEKFEQLFRHYGIDPTSSDAFAQLAMHLAFDHVPGLTVAIPKEKKGPGAPAKWTDADKLKLVADVSELADSAGSDRNACRILNGKTPYCERGITDQALWRRYMDFKDVYKTYCFVEEYERNWLSDLMKYLVSFYAEKEK